MNKNEPNFQSQCCCFSMFRKKRRRSASAISWVFPTKQNKNPYPAGKVRECAIASNKWFDFENVSVTHCCWIIYTSHGKGWDKSKTKHSARWQTYEFNSLEHKKISQKSFSWYFLPKKNNVHVDASNYTALEKTQCF